MNYVSLFCKDLQCLLRPIVELTWKGRPFQWGPEQEKSFRQIKKQLQRPPVLHLPRADGRVILYSDTSREGTGSSLWQVQEGKPRLIGFASKTLPEACQRYSVTELEMTGLLVNMGLWKSIIRHREFDAAVDHAAVAQIMKAKAEPATTRIKCLLERLASYSFNLYYVKGKDMILADYLSRHRRRSDDPNDLIPISFRLTRPVHIDPITPRCLPMMTRSSAKAVGMEPPPVHGAEKGIDPHKKPEHQNCSSRPPPGHPPKPSAQSTLGQLPVPVPRPRSRVQEVARKILDRSKSLQRRSSSRPQPSLSPAAPAGRGESVVVPRTPVSCAHTSSRKPQGTITPQVPLPLGRVPRSSRSTSPDDLIPEEILDVNKYTKRHLQNAQRPIPGIDLGEEEEILDPEVRAPNDEDFIRPPPLEELVDPTKIKQTFIPHQGELTKLLKQIRTRILRSTHLVNDLRDLKAAYLTSPHFRDIYIYLNQNKVPLNRLAARRIEINSRNYMLLDGLLFKILDTGVEDPTTVLCIPTSKAHVLMEYYHSSIMGGHTGITKCFQTISKRFYCPNLAEQLRAYITGCHICQLFKKGRQFDRPLQKRVNLNVPAMTKISMDMKEMPPSNGYTHILVILCEVSNFMVALPLHSTRTQTILDAFQKGYLAYFGPPTHIMCDQDTSFSSSLMEAFAEKLNIRMIMVSTTNHKSLLAEHGIKSLSNLLVKHLSGLWSWYNCLPYAMLCYNSYSTPNLDNYSPYELVFGHKMTLNPKLEIEPQAVVTAHFHTYYEKLKKSLTYMRERLQRFRSARTDLWNRNKVPHAFEAGQIVYLYQAKGTIVQTGSRKIACYFVGPLVIYKAVSPNQFILMSLSGQVYPHLIEESRIKPGSIWTTKGNVKTLAQLKAVLSAGLRIDSQAL